MPELRQNCALRAVPCAIQPPELTPRERVVARGSPTRVWSHRTTGNGRDAHARGAAVALAAARHTPSRARGGCTGHQRAAPRTGRCCTSRLREPGVHTGCAAMSRTGPMKPVSAAQTADWPRLAETWGSLRRDLALRAASGEPAGRSLCHLVLDTGAPAGRVQGIGQGADMLAKDGPAAGDVLYPPSLIGLWRCERTVSSVEGDAQQACNRPATNLQPHARPRCNLSSGRSQPGCNPMHSSLPPCVAGGGRLAAAGRRRRAA